MTVLKQNSCGSSSAPLQVCDPWGREALENFELFSGEEGNYTLKGNRNTNWPVLMTMPLGPGETAIRFKATQRPLQKPSH